METRFEVRVVRKVREDGTGTLKCGGAGDQVEAEPGCPVLVILRARPTGLEADRARRTHGEPGGRGK